MLKTVIIIITYSKISYNVQNHVPKNLVFLPRRNLVSDRQRKLHDAAVKKSDGKGYADQNLLSHQNFIYNSKKFCVNHLMYPSRILYLGGNICHVNHLQLLMDHKEMARFDQGQQQPDINRRKRMICESAHRLLFSKVRDCMQKI